MQTNSDAVRTRVFMVTVPAGEAGNFHQFTGTTQGFATIGQKWWANSTTGKVIQTESGTLARACLSCEGPGDRQHPYNCYNRQLLATDADSIMPTGFEWDPEKARRNQKKHGV